jgi:hypothetical protein
MHVPREHWRQRDPHQEQDMIPSNALRTETTSSPQHDDASSVIDVRVPPCRHTTLTGHDHIS